jgi:hypothetical protein
MSETTKLDKQPVDIDIAEDEDAINRVLQFRAKVETHINGEGKNSPPEDIELVKDDFDDSGNLIYAESSGNVVASFRLNFGEDTNISDEVKENYGLELFSDYHISELSFTSKLLVDPQWRNTTVLGKLLDASYRMMRIKKINFDFCDCAPAMVQFYEHLGYRRYKENFMDDTDGFRIPMVLIIEDIANLQKFKSPFLHVAEKFENTSVSTDWFNEKLPPYFGVASERLLSIDDFWRFLSESLDAAKVPLLRDLTQDEVKKFLTTGIILNVKKGDKIVRKGDIGNEMFVILSGSVDVHGRIDNKDCSVAKFSKGEIFGEMGFLDHTERSADVVAEVDMEILVLTQSFLRKSMRMIPETAAKILFNLSVILCERLRTNTTNLIESLTVDGDN